MTFKVGDLVTLKQNFHKGQFNDNTDPFDYEGVIGEIVEIVKSEHHRVNIWWPTLNRTELWCVKANGIIYYKDFQYVKNHLHNGTKY